VLAVRARAARAVRAIARMGRFMDAPPGVA
jgi:hypothetical protein